MDAVRKWVAPAAVAALVVAGAGGVAWLGGDDGAPRPLRLTGTASTGLGAPAADSERSGPSGYTYSGTLPTDQPGDRPVWRLRPAEGSDAARVAAAFGLSGEPKRVDGGWVVSGGERSLTLWDGGSWSYGGACGTVSSDGREIAADCTTRPGTAVSGSGTVEPDPGDGGSTPGSGTVEPEPAGDGAGGCDPATADCLAPTPSKSEPPACEGPECPVSSPPDRTPTEPATTDPATSEPVPAPVPEPTPEPGPSEAEARAAADPVLAKLGLDDAFVTVYVGSPQTTVQADPRVGGLETNGVATTLAIARGGRIDYGSGTLTDASRGDSYPLVSAKEAFDALPEQPRALAAQGCPVGPDGEGCAEPEPVELSDARLGLAVYYEAERPLLAPAWLFTMKGGGVVAQVAVEPAYLADPAAPTDKPEPDPGTTDPGSVPPDGEPGTTEPGEPGSGPDEPTGTAYPASWSGATLEGDRVLRIDGLDAGAGVACGTRYRAMAKESAESVYVLVERIPPGEGAHTCALPPPPEVTLQAALGDRLVYDAHTGERRPVTRP